MYQHSIIVFLSVWILVIKLANADIYCYSCVSTQPGCDEFNIDWRIHKAQACTNEDDRCVKIIEKRKDETLVTRDCLSNLIGLRSDLPADTFEGCRPAAQAKLAIYVENNIKELDLQRNYYDSTSFCFCGFDHFCNSSPQSIKSSFIHICVVIIISLLLSFHY